MCSCPDFPTSIIEDTIFSPLYILASIVKDWLTICAWVYFLALYSVPLISVAVFLLVSCGFDHCSLVLYSKVKEQCLQLYFYSQDSFYYFESFLVSYKF